MVNIRATQIADGTIQRQDLDASTAGSAVIRKVLPGSGVSIISTGPDPGTGDVTISATGVGGGGGEMFSYLSGNYHGLGKTASAHSAGSYSANNLRAFPWWIDAGVSFDRVLSEVTTLLAGSLYRLGLYDNQPGGLYPNVLIANSDTGEYSGAVTGVKTGIPAGNIVIPSAGWYWVAHIGNAGQAMRQYALAGIPCPLGQNTAAGLVVFSCLAIAQAYGALPATFPAGAVKTSSVLPPVATFRVV